MHDQLSYYFTQGEEEAVNDLLAALRWDKSIAGDARSLSVELIEKIRKTRRKAGSLESFFQEYGLDTKEGLALMSLAEALLRIPDNKTAYALIRDKVAGTNWIKQSKGKKDWMTKVAGVGLSLTSGTVNTVFSKLGDPVIHGAMKKAMTVLGKQFVVGETLAGAQKIANKWQDQGFRFSYDVLGEGARTMRDAVRYFEAYKGALNDIADLLTDEQKKLPCNQKPGISVKLSALYPRYEYAQHDACVSELSEKLYELCQVAVENNLTLTVDAEEVARLIPSLEIIEAVLEKLGTVQWDGLGLAVQGYQKAAPSVIDHVIKLAHTYDRTIQVRLVKGAYWDTEIRQSQLQGFEDYPVFTRKSNTDLCYLRCVQKLLKNRDKLYPMFGTHNAHTVAAIITLADKDLNGFEFQKLYGMGDALYKALLETNEVNVCVYAPIGPYHDLLPYLVRRMLENGANSSFVNQIYDPNLKPEDVAQDPVEKAKVNEEKHHPKIPLPVRLFGASRKNSLGLNLDDPVVVQRTLSELSVLKTKQYQAFPLINGKEHHEGMPELSVNPANVRDIVGEAIQTSISDIDYAFKVARTGQKTWMSVPASQRAQTLENIADLYEANTVELMSLCMREGGRTMKDAHDEVREAVDFCRYYASLGRTQFDAYGRYLTSPTGETNVYQLEGRGIFACISPWNFPLAIFTGQIVASLMAGNAVIAKPAEQTPLTGNFAVRLMHKAGVPVQTLTLLIGDGEIGASIVEHAALDGVAFTGSTGAAQSINRTLAAKNGKIARLVAETGGQNAMIVDSSALTEQVIDDVIHSAFGSAGQRCSACRILYVQEDVADKTILMLQGAMQELKIGDPVELKTDIGPLIDEEAYRAANRHKVMLDGLGKKIGQVPMFEELRNDGHYFAPLAYEIEHLDVLQGEVFAPILHVIRYNVAKIDDVINEINALDYGLTFGIHSRNENFISDITARIDAGNIYVNRGTIGAVVGVQPFGGRGLSGTGPKAGGPNYLSAFATEKVISTDTTAAGGNTSLVMLGE